MTLRFIQDYGKYKKGQVCEVLDIYKTLVLFTDGKNDDVVRMINKKLLRSDNGEEYGVLE